MYKQKKIADARSERMSAIQRRLQGYSPPKKPVKKGTPDVPSKRG